MPPFDPTVAERTAPYNVVDRAVLYERFAAICGEPLADKLTVAYGEYSGQELSVSKAKHIFALVAAGEIPGLAESEIMQIYGYLNDVFDALE